MTRDEVLIEFHEPYNYEIVPGLRRRGMQLDTDAMADEIVRLREELAQQAITLSAEHQQAERILAALREPSKTIVRAAQQTWDGDYCHMGVAIRAAVAAAEKEVQYE